MSGHVRVGCYVEPIAPLWAMRANLETARLLGADDIWVGDHTKAMFPSSAWSTALSQSVFRSGARKRRTSRR